MSPLTTHGKPEKSPQRKKTKLHNTTSQACRTILNILASMKQTNTVMLHYRFSDSRIQVTAMYTSLTWFGADSIWCKHHQRWLESSILLQIGIVDRCPIFQAVALNFVLSNKVGMGYCTDNQVESLCVCNELRIRNKYKLALSFTKAVGRKGKLFLFWSNTEARPLPPFLYQEKSFTLPSLEYGY